MFENRLIKHRTGRNVSPLSINSLEGGSRDCPDLRSSIQNSFENLISTLGLKVAVSTRSTGTENRIFKGGAMKRTLLSLGIFSRFC